MWMKLLGGGIVLALAGLLLWQYGEAKYDQGKLAERAVQAQAARLAERQRAEERVADANRVTAAVEDYAARLAGFEPVIVRSMNTVREYASTPAGAAVCLSADRVSGIDADAAALGLRPPAPAPAVAGALPSDTDPAAE